MTHEDKRVKELFGTPGRKGRIGDGTRIAVHFEDGTSEIYTELEYYGGLCAPWPDPNSFEVTDCDVKLEGDDDD